MEPLNHFEADINGPGDVKEQISEDDDEEVDETFFNTEHVSRTEELLQEIEVATKEVSSLIQWVTSHLGAGTPGEGLRQAGDAPGLSVSTQNQAGGDPTKKNNE